MIIQIPRYQKVLYVFSYLLSYQTNLFEALKYSWMQYFSIFLIFWFLGQHILEYVVQNHVFATYKMTNVPKALQTYQKLKRD